MAEALFDSQNSGNSDWATDIAFTLSARTVHVVNNGAYPVRVRFGAGTATSGSATGKVAPGASKTWTFQTSQRKDRIALYGVGGVSSCDVEVSSDEMGLAYGGPSGNLVLADLSSATPAAVGTAAAGTAATAARSDHAHALGSISASLGTESGNKRQVTYTNLGTHPLHLTLRTATGALADGSAGQALELVTSGGTTAAWSLGSGSCVTAIITPNSGSVIVNVNDKSSSLSGSVWLTAEQPATGASRTDEIAFT